MGDILTPVDVGFAEFVAKLIGEVFDSIVTAQAEQEERFGEIMSAASLSTHAFGERFLAEEDLERELARLFPPRPSDGGRSHSVYPGSPYRPAGREGGEDPPYQVLTGVELGGDDRQKTEGGIVLSERGAARIAQEVREALAASRLRSLREAVARGVPRVVVDSGRINGKLTFQLVTTQEIETGPVSPSAPREGGALRPPLFQPDLGRLVGLRPGRILPKVRVLVKPADDRAPQSSVRSDVYGEVEITFKTVT